MKIVNGLILFLFLVSLPTVGMAKGFEPPVPPNPPGPGEWDPGDAPAVSYPSSARPLASGFSCQYHPTVQQILSNLDQNTWRAWISKLSGAESVTVGGSSAAIQTRYTYAMFGPERANARAYSYVLEQVRAWVTPSQIEEDTYTYQGYTWKNLIVTLPGESLSQEVIVLSAHLDSYSSDPWNNAPGAEDNASGAAALLEAARVLSQYQFQRTIRLIWFTGEEQGLLGSQAYLSDHTYNNIAGVINFDMFGYDADGDRCFEMHVGTLAASNQVGQCYADTIAAYQIDVTYDYLINSSLGCRSDHCPFWNRGVGAVEILENNFIDSTGQGCGGRRDSSPYYHTTGDTVGTLNASTGFDTARAGIAAAANMALPLAPLTLTIGTYDDSDAKITLNGSWSHLFESGLYNDTASLSSAPGDSAQFSYRGPVLKILYTGHPSYGTLDVIIDETVVATIDQQSDPPARQLVWMSAEGASTPHNVILRHASGGPVNLDGVVVDNAQSTLAIDDQDAAFQYTGSGWNVYQGILGGPLNGSGHYSTVAGDAAQLSFDGEGVKILYAGTSNRGRMDVSLDGVLLGTLDQYTSALQFQRAWTSPRLSAGSHTLALVHAAGDYIDLDAVTVFTSGSQTYDDIDSLITYSGDWRSLSGVLGGPLNGTGHYSTAAGASAALPFTGKRVKIIFTGSANRGGMEVKVDGDILATVTQNTAGLQFQQAWTSDPFTSGSHTLTLTNVGAATIDLDGIVIER